MNTAYQASRSFLKCTLAILQGIVVIGFGFAAATAVSCLIQGSL